MSRDPRVWVPGGFYHVYSRGNRRQLLFRDDSDYEKFLDLVRKCKKKYQFIVHTYCLMPNHFHMIVSYHGVPLGKPIGWFSSIYARFYNDKYGYDGHLFQGRYHAKIITNTRYLLIASKYIHLNPVKAGIVISPEKYRYSSFKSFAYEKNDDITTKDRIMEYFDNDVNWYKGFVKSAYATGEEETMDKELEMEEE